MQPDYPYRHLLKFLLLSVFSFFVGTLHGMLQVTPPIRAWLDSIGSPYSNPGHMIDPLAHAHMNLVGGVVLLSMAVTYYLIPVFSGKKIYSLKMVDYTFWWVAVGSYGFYATQMFFGISEGLLLNSAPAKIASLHHFYGPCVAVCGTVMAVGFLVYLINVFCTMVWSKKRIN